MLTNNSAKKRPARLLLVVGQVRQRCIRHGLAQAPIKLRRVAVALQLQRVV